LAQWALAIAFTGVTVGVCTQFHAFSSEQRSRYRVAFIFSLILIWVGTVIQMTLA
jgi:hypothetical protein